jgi:1-aminocyclopropane-1-carboxylate synthase
MDDSVEPVWVSVGAVEDHEKALLQARESGREIKALLLCNPHNPLGRCYSKEVLEAYLKLCGKYNIHLIRYEV